VLFVINNLKPKMKKLILSLMTMFMVFSAFSQTVPPAPGTGRWVIVDTNYTVGTSSAGVTKANLYYRNNTSTKITGMQFRVWYDKDAFNGSAPTVALKYGATDQYMQYVTNTTEGNITVTLVYTGTSSTFSYSDGAAVEVTLTHASAATWNTLDSIKTMKITGTTTFNNLAATNYGNDTTMTVYSYGGNFIQRKLTFKGRFLTAAGDGAKNLWISLEKKPKTGSTWTTVNTYKTNTAGRFNFTETLDTTYWDTRIAIKGDTMSYGNALSTADAQKINQVMLGQYTPTGFDFYAMDVNGNNSITIADAYSVFGNIAGRFTSWPNSVQNLLFFTKTERDSINGKTVSKAATIPGATNFTHYINGGVDSVTYYVVVKGDANSTGFKMARLTPIRIVNPANANRYIIDNTVQYDNVLQTIEVNMPKINVEEGNLVNIPVKVFTNGKTLGALQLDLKYDTDLLEFRKVENSEKAMKWISYVNPSNGIVSWGGFDIQNSNMLNDGDQVFTLQFVAKKPQSEWGTAAVWTGEKYVGDNVSKDMNITPAMGIIEVRKMAYRPKINPELFELRATPNPNDGNMVINFNILEEGKTEVSIFNMQGQKVIEVVNENMPKGEYVYSVNSLLPAGIYYASVNNNGNFATNKILINK
jgi:hypothetical protein